MKDNIRDQRTKATERCQKTELPDLFTQIETHLGLVKIGTAMLFAEVGFDRQTQSPESEQEKNDDRASDHSSLP